MMISARAVMSVSESAIACQIPIIPDKRPVLPPDISGLSALGSTEIPCGKMPIKAFKSIPIVFCRIDQLFKALTSPRPAGNTHAHKPPICR
ncbi:hypothetical protein V6667_06030 [Neisseria leonii]|uniref:hypothetical protein n=1 Tax=Neisseria leonii TaxID=2995413 RepID=UPI0030D36D0B